jgi:hypothetical protein
MPRLDLQMETCTQAQPRFPKFLKPRTGVQINHRPVQRSYLFQNSSEIVNQCHCEQMLVQDKVTMLLVYSCPLTHFLLSD